MAVSPAPPLVLNADGGSLGVMHTRVWVKSPLQCALGRVTPPPCLSPFTSQVRAMQPPSVVVGLTPERVKWGVWNTRAWSAC